MRIIHTITYVLLLLLVSCGGNEEQNSLEDNELDLHSLKSVADRDEGLFIKEMINIGEDSIGVWTLKAFLHESSIVIAEALVLSNDTTYSTRYYYDDNDPYAAMQTIKFGGEIISESTVYLDENAIIEIKSKPNTLATTLDRAHLHSVLYNQALKLAENYRGDENTPTENLVPIRKFKDLR